MIKGNRFKAGSGVYTCNCCGHRTRDTGGDGANVGLCDLCYELAGYENEVMDGLQDQWTKRSMETIVNMITTVYNRGGERVWDSLLQQVVTQCEQRIASGQQ